MPLLREKNRWILAASIVFVLPHFLAGRTTFADGLENITRPPEHAFFDEQNVPTSPPSLSFDPQATHDRIASMVEFLSSDRLEGRGVGKVGLVTASHYIAKAFTEARLRTDLWNGRPYQDFRVSNVTGVVDPASNILSFRHRDGSAMSCTLGEDFQSMAVGGNGGFTASLAFVGYGISAYESNWNYDEFENIDVRGKVLMMLRKEPQQADANSRFSGQQTSPHAFFATKIENARQRGAVGLLFINDFLTVQGNQSANNSSLDILPPSSTAGQSSPTASLPTMFISRVVAQELLSQKDSGLRLENIEQQIDATLKPQSFDIDSMSAIGRTNLVRQNVTASNVVGILEGRGYLANETVVIGAHYDHVGMGEVGSLAPGEIAIHNGADDNASGTAALIEVVRRFSAEHDQVPAPQRKIVFVAFSGEERGLLGSRYFVQHPVCDIHSISAMLNMDMVGRMGSNQIIVYGVGSSPDFANLVSQRAQTLGLVPNLQQPAMGPSDHQPFFENNIPVMHFFTGIHPQYHRPSDDFERINVTGIARITDMVYQVALQLATQSERPRFVRVAGRANIQIPSQERGRLGIRLDSDLLQARIETVTIDSAAAKAGLRPDDEIIALNGEEMKSRILLLRKMQSFAPKQQIGLTILRDGKTRNISVELDHY